MSTAIFNTNSSSFYFPVNVTILIVVCSLMSPLTSTFAQGQPPGDTNKNNLDSLDIMIGQMIMTGIGDFSYMSEDESILYEIARGYVGGVIFFEKNINPSGPARQLKRTIDSLQAVAQIPLFVSIDEEGGKVTRLKSKYGFPKTVTAAYLGKVDDIDSTDFYATKTATNLAQLGFILNYAPDVDVAVNPNNPVIAKVGRSYSADERLVAKHAGQVVKSHRDQNVLTVLKHFPGHGSSHSDTHLGIADVTDYWQFRELMPYKTLLDSNLVDGIMTAHIVNGHLDETKLPATLSPSIISNILRGVLNYNGVVFSDDMQMHAISKHYGFEQSIKLAIEAGVDVIMFANNVPGNQKRNASEIHTAIKELVIQGIISSERIKISFDRILQLKSKLNKHYAE